MAEAEQVRAVLKKVGQHINNIYALLYQANIRRNIGRFGWSREIVQSLQNDFNRVLSIYGGSCGTAAAASAPSPIFLHPASSSPAAFSTNHGAVNGSSLETEEERVVRIRSIYPTREAYWADPARPLIFMNEDTIWGPVSGASFPPGNIRGFFAPKKESGAGGEDAAMNGIALPFQGSFGGKRYRRMNKKRMTRRKRKE